MAWRGRSVFALGKWCQPHSSGNAFQSFKPLIYSQSFVITNPNTQVRFNSTGVAAVTEFVAPEAPVTTIFSDTGLTLATQDLLCQIHDLSGFAWAPTIVLSTFALRLLLGLPTTLIQQKSLGRLANLKPQLDQLASDLKREVSIAVKIYNWDQRKAFKEFNVAFKRHYRNIVQEHNCHPGRALALPLIQLPVWICMSSAIRNLACMTPTTLPDATEQQLRYMEMMIENPAWIESLVLPDPFLVPAAFILVNLVNIQIHSATSIKVPQTTLQKSLPWVFRTAVVGVGIMGAYVPSAVSLYWLASSVSGLMVNVILKVNPVRGALGLPKNPAAATSPSLSRALSPWKSIFPSRRQPTSSTGA